MGKTHGLAVINGKRTRLNRIWKQMRQRCLNPNDSAYNRYGGRGIKICPEWDEYLVFRGWAISHGYNDILEIERIDNYGNYCPENCTWIRPGLQARNKRNNHLVTFEGETLSLAEWAERLDLNYNTIRSRLNLGWADERALTTPIRRLQCKKP
uniref:Uncharacterized protein n=1 Tax=viral metagenome TaxID=1070528 RepID=A0A6M3ISH4_9ZZZZ